MLLESNILGKPLYFFTTPLHQPLAIQKQTIRRRIVLQALSKIIADGLFVGLGDLASRPQVRLSLFLIRFGLQCNYGFFSGFGDGKYIAIGGK